MLVRIFIFIFLASFDSNANGCIVDDNQKENISLNSLNSLDVKELFSTLKLERGNYYKLQGIYLPENFVYEREELPSIEGKITVHIFKGAEYILYYREHSPSILHDLRFISGKNDSSFELVKLSLNYFNNPTVDFCKPEALSYYLYYSALFPNGSAKKISFGMNESVIIGIRDNKFSRFNFLVNHTNKDKIWSVMFEKIN